MDKSDVNYSTTSTTQSSDMVTISPEENEQQIGDDLNYLLLTGCTLVVIIALTIIVIMLLQRKRKIDRLRHHLMPFYNFAPGEEEDWETELLESEGEGQSRRV